MKNILLGAFVAAGVFLAAPSASAYTAQALCPQWVQRGPIVNAVCFSGHGDGLVPAAIDIRTCAPGADINNYFGQLVCINPQRRAYGYPPPPPPEYGLGRYREGGWRRDDPWRHRPRGPNWD